MKRKTVGNKSDRFLLPLTFEFLSFRETPRYHHNADDDKGDAEPLTHVESHVFLKLDLHVLQELNANTRAENDDEEGAEHQAGLLVAEVAFVVHPQEDAHRHEAEESLVKPSRVARQPFLGLATIRPRGALRVVVESAAKLLVAAHEDETPWQRGRRAINLVVHHVAHANQRTYEAHGNDNAVEYPYITDFL